MNSLWDHMKHMHLTKSIRIYFFILTKNITFNILCIKYIIHQKYLYHQKVWFEMIQHHASHQLKCWITIFLIIWFYFKIVYLLFIFNTHGQIYADVSIKYRNTLFLHIFKIFHLFYDSIFNLLTYPSHTTWSILSDFYQTI